ncbi:putative secreted glycoprotein (plasmid) [Haloferax gibbonsii]|uniref:Secreted glycoprotein n=1 Tax=Haloferax gibbonsii TaxID=35746 RepID=A0A871BKV6_HALGI|nr:hypothetical protein [Haloferax gibbonsii]QOS13385.1 putative secreted glycoprotein [Haloferax gibbonsii]
MNQDQSHFNRRTVLQTAAGLSLAGLAGCLNGGGETGDGTTTANDDPDGQAVLSRVAVEETTLVVELGSEAEVDQVNLIQPNGELFGRRDVVAGVRQVSFEIGTAYDPGEYRVLAVQGEDTLDETSLEVRPELEIVDVGLFRNNPDKPWDEVYGESETNRIKDSEAFVLVHNSGTGPDAVISLRFSGDVPNPVENPRNEGLYEVDEVVIPAGETRDVYSNSLPFSAKIGDDAMGCSVDTNAGMFSAHVGSSVSGDELSKEFNIEYSGSDTMTDCKVTINEV